ncbi:MULTISPECIES: hypothetical protein [unclassified Leptolyngbya]|uniref:hypothetical protein n=1 Tax=unclassified Leptolyngbya TaxID=2650499 RepID=UPI0016824F1D|nr:MULTISPECIES: hypothetical protein [unclassified Leptolyngbya]MBD1913693.1 hypothetical protein [Leptolyngbya sp. FACHB-8]MBD2156385.1 hypothetical protein [Leptolyngbya sp. FACHB-16]
MVNASQSRANTGTGNTEYNLVSILYHSLEEAATCEQYMADAEQQNDQDIAQFLREVQDEDRRRADRAKQLLKNRL